jgi:hypothetical protein
LSFPLTSPLPPSLASDRLTSHLTQHVRFLQIKQVLHQTPRQLSTPTPSTSAVRSLAHPSTEQFDSLMIAALRTPGPCILCRSSEHKFAQCPSLATLLNEPYLPLSNAPSHTTTHLQHDALDVLDTHQFNTSTTSTNYFLC